jgi:dUTPase
MVGRQAASGCASDLSLSRSGAACLRSAAYIKAYTSTSNNNMSIQLINPHAQIPVQNPGEAGYRMLLPESITIPARQTTEVGFGFSIKCPRFHFMQLYCTLEANLDMVLVDGLIDDSKRDEVSVSLINHGESDVQLEKGTEVCQGAFVRFYSAPLKHTETRPDTDTSDDDDDDDDDGVEAYLNDLDCDYRDWLSNPAHALAHRGNCSRGANERTMQ